MPVSPIDASPVVPPALEGDQRRIGPAVAPGPAAGAPPQADAVTISPLARALAGIAGGDEPELQLSPERLRELAGAKLPSDPASAEESRHVA